MLCSVLLWTEALENLLDSYSKSKDQGHRVHWEDIVQSVSCAAWSVPFLFMYGNYCIVLLIFPAFTTASLARTSEIYRRTCAPSEDSDQPAHSRSLIKILTGRILDSQGCKFPLSEQRRQIRLWGCEGWFESSLGAHVRRYVFLCYDYYGL